MVGKISSSYFASFHFIRESIIKGISISMESISTKYNSGFWVLTGMQFVISVADWMLLVLLQIIVFDLTHSAFNVMLLVAGELVPMLLFGAWAGVLVDRFNLRQVLIWSCGIRVIIISALFLPLIREQFSYILAIAVLAATCNRFFVPAESALLPHIVSKDNLPRANAIIMGVRFAGMAVGTLIAGAATSSSGGYTFAIGIIMGLLILACFLCVLLPALYNTKQTAESEAKGSLWDDLKITIRRYGSTLLFPMNASILVMLMLGSFEILALVYVTKILGRPSTDVGFFFGAYGVGMFAGLILSSWKIVMQQYVKSILICIVLMCLSVWGLSQTHSFNTALFIIVVVGVVEGMIITTSLLRIYQQVEEGFYARVISLLDTGSGAAYLISIMLIGVVADKLSADLLLKSVAMTISILSSLVLMWFFHLRKNQIQA